jgi:ABC-type transport system involved in multi-copper enzyme maturation permease subunit
MPIILRWLLRLGPTNPIAVRLVHNASRRTKHMYIRAAYLAVLIVVLLTILLSTNSHDDLSYQKLAQSGAGAFTKIAYLQILLICVLAPVFLGGAIAQESSPRTWDILLTTPLTASEIVLGNLFGRLLFIMGLLFCSLPLFALTQYFGGVPGSSIMLSYLVAASAALLVGALAIALAVSRLVGKRAFFAFYIAIVSYLGVTLAIDYWLVMSGQGAVTGTGVTYMTALNPFLALKSLLNPSTYPRAPEGSQTGFIARWMLERPVGAFCLGSTLLSIFFMVGSTFTVRSGGLQTIGTDESGLSLYERIFGSRSRNEGESAGVHRAPRPVGINPIVWREASSRNSQPSKIIARWVFVLVGFLFAAGLVRYYHVASLTHDTFQFAMVTTVWVELTVISLVAIMAAATAISKEREDGTLDLLLTTPMTASAYLTGKLRGLIAYLLPLLSVPLGTLFIGGGYVFFHGFAREGGVEVSRTIGGTPTSVPVMLPEAGLLVTIATIPFLAFCVMVGLQWSLKSKGTLGSIVGTVGVVGAISGVVGLCGWNVSQGLGAVGPVFGSLSPASLVAAVVDPADRIADAMSKVGVSQARVVLAIGSVVAAGVYSAICYSIHANMVRTFDMTVRGLAGNR